MATVLDGLRQISERARGKIEPHLGAITLVAFTREKGLLVWVEASLDEGLTAAANEAAKAIGHLLGQALAEKLLPLPLASAISDEPSSLGKWAFSVGSLARTPGTEFRQDGTVVSKDPLAVTSGLADAIATAIKEKRMPNEVAPKPPGRIPRNETTEIRLKKLWAEDRNFVITKNIEDVARKINRSKASVSACPFWRDELQEKRKPINTSRRKLDLLERKEQSGRTLTEDEEAEVARLRQAFGEYSSISERSREAGM